MSPWPEENFSDLVADETGGNAKTLQSDYLPEGTYPIVDQGQSLIGGYTNDSSRVCKAELPVIVFGDHTKCFKYIDFPFCLGADGTKILRPKRPLNERYLFYALQRIHIPDAGYSRHFKYLKEGKIPLPPLEEQKRIAAILDQADELRRKRQRALDRLNQLGQAIFIEMFGDPSINPFNLPAYRLGDLASFGSGGTPSKLRDDFWNGDFPWVSPKDVKVLRIHDAEDHISDTVFKETPLKKIQPNTPLIVVRGMILAHTVPIAMAMREIAINQDINSIHYDKRVLPEFGLWCLRVQHNAILKKVDTAAHGTRRLDSDVLKAFSILAPHMDAQQRFSDRIWASEALQEKLCLQANLLQSGFCCLQHRTFRGELPASSLKEAAA
jgi:type I restriction enzyme S subunit